MHVSRPLSGNGSSRECVADCPDLTRAIHEMSESFGWAIDAKDHFTKNHSDEVAVVAHAVALAMGLTAMTADVIHIAGHLHDIGKIGVPDSVLNKNGPLTESEWRMVRRHPETGRSILAPVRAMIRMGVPDIVVCHHERFDGLGYPKGLAGHDIPLGARVIAVADSLSAMLQQRSYRMALDFDDACQEIRLGAGAQFDPAVVEAFLSIREPVRQMLVYSRHAATDPLDDIDTLDDRWMPTLPAPDPAMDNETGKERP